MKLESMTAAAVRPIAVADVELWLLWEEKKLRNVIRL